VPILIEFTGLSIFFASLHYYLAPVLTDSQFNEAYAKHARSVYFAIRRIVNNEAVAEEIMQEAFLRFLQKADSRRTDEHKSFLIHISHNLAIDHLKKTSRVRNTDSMQFEADKRDYAEESEGRILRDNIIADLSKLNSRYLRIFLLRVDYQMTYEEISDLMKIPKRTLMRYVDHLKTRLQDFV